MYGLALYSEQLLPMMTGLHPETSTSKDTNHN